MTSVDHESVDPLSILERSSSEKELIVVEGVSSVFESKGTFKSVELVIRRLTDHLA